MPISIISINIVLDEGTRIERKGSCIARVLERALSEGDGTLLVRIRKDCSAPKYLYSIHKLSARGLLCGFFNPFITFPRPRATLRASYTLALPALLAFACAVTSVQAVAFSWLSHALSLSVQAAASLGFHTRYHFLCRLRPSFLVLVRNAFHSPPPQSETARECCTTLVVRPSFP